MNKMRGIVVEMNTILSEQGARKPRIEAMLGESMYLINADRVWHVHFNQHWDHRQDQMIKRNTNLEINDLDRLE